MSLLRRYAPSVSADPLELTLRLLRSGNPAARSALGMALAGLALSPLDAALARRERRLCGSAPAPRLPILLVCGAPRSGTTLLAQFLVNRLDVGYVNNLASLFPKAPIAANRLFGVSARRGGGGYDAFYGRSTGLSGVNDALFVWDRWLGSDREAVPSDIPAEARADMSRFFGALQRHTSRPIVNKANRLFTCASLVASSLPTATFVCLRRDPVMLAQSLLLARDEITGDRARAYGVRHDDPVPDDPIEDVCRQVEFYERRIEAQARALGPERFIVVGYEAFCAAPDALLDTLLERGGDALTRRAEAGRGGQRFETSSARRLPREVFATLERRLRRTDAPAA